MFWFMLNSLDCLPSPDAGACAWSAGCIPCARTVAMVNIILFGISSSSTRGPHLLSRLMASTKRVRACSVLRSSLRLAFGPSRRADSNCSSRLALRWRWSARADLRWHSGAAYNSRPSALLTADVGLGAPRSARTRWSIRRAMSENPFAGHAHVEALAGAPVPPP